MLVGIVQMSSNPLLCMCCGCARIGAVISHCRFHWRRDYSWQLCGYLKSVPSIIRAILWVWDWGFSLPICMSLSWCHLTLAGFLDHLLCPANVPPGQLWLFPRSRQRSTPPSTGGPCSVFGPGLALSSTLQPLAASSGDSLMKWSGVACLKVNR